MKKSVKILIICVLIAALIAGGVIYLIFQTRDDDLLIGEDRAQQIALNDAGLAANQVSRLKARIKLDDGVWCYKVTFRTIAIEYEYEIEAYSGAILEKVFTKNLATLVKKSVPDVFDGYLSNHEWGLCPLALPCCSIIFNSQHSFLIV